MPLTQLTQLTDPSHWPLISWTLTDHYYFANKFWLLCNLAMIPCFLLPCLIRFRNPSPHTPLYSDHLSRLFLFISWLFYIYDMAVKYPIDGAQTICQKAFFIHHTASLFIMPPLFLNTYIPWFVCPIGFMHGFALYFPHLQWINYVYAACLFIFQYGIYQEPYRRMWGYGVLRYVINLIWVFALMVLFGGCSNYLPVEEV